MVLSLLKEVNLDKTNTLSKPSGSYQLLVRSPVVLLIVGSLVVALTSPLHEVMHISTNCYYKDANPGKQSSTQQVFQYLYI